MRARSIVLAITSVALAAAMVGCGGSGGGAGGSRMATATFNITWPKPDTRVIPGSTNRFVVFVTGDGITQPLCYVVDATTTPGQTYTYRVPVPAGTRRLFSAVAKQISTPKYGSLTAVGIGSADLKDGSVLGAGNDPQPYNITAGSFTTANVEIKLPATPRDGVTGVTPTVQQVLGPNFPSTAVLALFRDQSGNPIKDLNIANLEVTEDGVPVVLTDVRTVVEAGQPISVALVLDRSGSMGSSGNADLETAANTFVSLMSANDAGEVVNFSSTATRQQAYTTDKTLLEAAITNHYLGGTTALWDAVGMGITDTAARGGRMAVLAMSDGYENNSVTETQATVTAAAKAAGVPIFSIGLGGSVDPGLEQVAVQTGGAYYPAPNSGQLADIYSRISGQLSGQLQITFISADPFKYTPGKTRHLVVTFHYGGLTGSASKDFTM